MKPNLSLFSVRSLLLYGTILTVAGILSAADYVDDQVPNNMDEGGPSPEQRVEYVLGESDNYVRNTNETIYVGDTHSYNDLHVKNSALIESQQLIIGNEATSGYNQVAIHDNATWHNNGTVTVGVNGSGNTLLVVYGAQLNNTVGVVGMYAGSSGNQALIGMANSVWRNTSGLAIGQEGNDNYMAVSQGGRVEVTGVSYIGAAATSYDNSVEVRDANSIWTTTSLQIGHPESNNNVLRIYDGGLVIVDNTLNIGDGTTEQNYIWLYNGYLAWYGDRIEEMVDMMFDCQLRTVDVEGAWFEFEYIESEEQSLLFTNGLYGDLIGYTLATAVPEPSTHALIVIGLLAVAHLRNRARGRTSLFPG